VRNEIEQASRAECAPRFGGKSLSRSWTAGAACSAERIGAREK